MKKIVYILGVITLLFTSCVEDNMEYFAKSDTNYYPLTSGMYNVYDVTEINIDEPSDVYDTLNYQLKELIGGKYYDNEGALSYTLIRYKRLNAEQAWQVSDVWATQYRNQRLFVTEENIKYIKIYFPLSMNKTWNGNAENTLEEQMYEIVDFDTPSTINSHTFDSCLTIQQEADSSLIHKDIVYEKYVRDTGLVCKKIIHINSQNIEPGVPIEDRITTGSIYIQKFIERKVDENYEDED